MLRHILFDVSFFETEEDRANSQKRVLALLEALVWCNRLYLQQHPETPLMYKSGIEYKVPEQFVRSELPEIETLHDYLTKKSAPQSVWSAFTAVSNMCGGGEHFREIPRIIENGGGDCDNVAAWRCAELRELGIDAKPFITWKRRADGGMTYHVIVRWPDGSSEDPSLLLGMGGDLRAADRQNEEDKLAERTAEFVAGVAQTGTVMGGIGAITTTQDFNQLQYTIPFQTDDSYEDWSPTRPQAFYANPLYPNLPTTKGGGPIFNTALRDYDEREERFDGLVRSMKREINDRLHRHRARKRAA